MRFVLLFFVYFCSCMVLLAQDQSVSGRIIGAPHDQKLAFSTISLLTPKDSSLLTFTIADSAGCFSLSIGKPGSFLLAVSHVGYIPVWKKINLKENESLKLEDLSLNEVQTIEGITITGVRPPVELKDDVIEFNTEHYKTPPNAVVEDMLKRMPGMTVDRNGIVRSNGKSIRRVLVNGKEFFTGNPLMATQNLNADWVDKVQVYERKSDRAQFTGMDDGNNETVINLVLKKDKNRAVFGRSSAGLGTLHRYESQANINLFLNEKQRSIIGMGNNTNKQGFSMADMLSFNNDLQRNMMSAIEGNGALNGEDLGLPVSGLAQQQQGIATTYAGGININEQWENKTDMNVSLQSSDIQLHTEKYTWKDNLLPQNQFFQDAVIGQDRRTKQHRLNATINHKIDTFHTLRMIPLLTFQQEDFNSLSEFKSHTPDGLPMNNGQTKNALSGDRMGFGNDLLFRKRFVRKGRTLSAQLVVSNQTSRSSGILNTDNTFFTKGLAALDTTIHQQSKVTGRQSQLNFSATYTELLGKRSLLEMTGYHQLSDAGKRRNTLDYNGQTDAFDVPNAPLTNDFSMKVVTNGSTLRVRMNRGKWSTGIGMSTQEARLLSENRSAGSAIHQRFVDVLPSATIRVKINQRSVFGINWVTNVQMPTAMQLQPVADNTDPLNIKVGNPLLRRSYNHGITANFTNLNFGAGRNLMFMAMVNQTNDGIVQSDVIRADGRRISTPVNADGLIKALANLNAGMALPRYKSNINMTMSMSYMESLSYMNGQRNEMTNLSLGPGFNWSFAIDNKINIYAAARWSFSQVSYSLLPVLNNHFMQQQYTLEMTNHLPGKIRMSNQVSYVVNTGRSAGFNTSVPYWTASWTKSFLKSNKGEIKISVTDVLNQNNGIDRIANQQFVEDVRYNMLNRYYSISVLYVLGKSVNSLPAIFVR